MSRALTVLFTLCFFLLLPLQAAPAPASLFPQDQQQDQGPAYENFSRDQLDNLLSPVALYPDPLLAQLFVAATFPDQVEEAARFVRANGPNGVDEQDWDVSVRAIAHYPTVIGMMADKIDWTTSLGQAYVNQSTDVAFSVQHLRRLARTAGNLRSSEQQEVLERRWLGRPLLHWVAQRRLGQWLLELRMDRAQPRTRELPKQRLRQQPL